MDFLKQAKNLITQNKYIVLILALGLVLMTFPSRSQEIPSAQPEILPTESAQEQLAQILGQIRGVGRVRVLLTVAQGEQTVYVYDENTSDTADSTAFRKEAVVVTDSSRSQSGLVTQVLPPVYLGAVVVCQGGDQPGVRLAIVEAVSAATGLTSDKISVLKMK